jgi:hypothetical protein
VAKLFKKVALIIVEVLKQSAIFTGHHDGLQIDPASNQQLQSTLNDVGLLEWFLLFQRDLNNLHSRVGKWEDEHEFYILNTHFERLFLQFGMVIEWNDETGMYLHVFPI